MVAFYKTPAGQKFFTKESEVMSGQHARRRPGRKTVRRGDVPHSGTR